MKMCDSDDYLPDATQPRGKGLTFSARGTRFEIKFFSFTTLTLSSLNFFSCGWSMGVVIPSCTLFIASWEYNRVRIGAVLFSGQFIPAQCVGSLLHPKQKILYHECNSFNVIHHKLVVKM